MRLQLATSQFPVSANIRANYRYISAHMREAKRRGAEVIHFPECALSGYAGIDFPSHEGFDWPQLQAHMREILKLAAQLQLWAIVGSIHKLSGPHKPHNSLYIIDDQGAVVDRYDKRFCELKHYSPGNHFSVFTLKGIRCGAMICHDYRYPELYREYKRMGIEIMFHSYHAGGLAPNRYKEIQRDILPFAKLNHGVTFPAITMPATMQSYAGNNYLWISCSNSSAKESCWPAFFVRPDGVLTGRLKRNVNGILISTVDTTKQWYDATSGWRELAMSGTFHSGKLVNDIRSTNRQKL